MKRILLMMVIAIFSATAFAGRGLESLANKVPLQTYSYVDGVDNFVSIELDQPTEQFDRRGDQIKKSQQTYQGIPVFGAQIVEVDRGKGVFQSGRFAMIGDLDTQPKINQADAVEQVANFLPDSNLSAELYVYPAEGRARLIWLIKEAPAQSRWWVFVDAHTNEIINAFNNIQDGNRSDDAPTSGDLIPIDPDDGPIYTPVNGTGTGVLGDTKVVEATRFTFGTFTQFQMKRSEHGVNRITRTANNTTNIGSMLTDSNNVWTATAQRAGVDAHHYTGQTLDFYRTILGRNSYDDQGHTVTPVVHYDSNLVNAYWNGTYLLFGDGDGVNSTGLSGALDVVAHEFSHAVTEHSSGLVYQNESGALNEAFSDIMGAATEFYYQSNQFDWMVGEDVWTPGVNGDALRYMNDPAQDGSSRDHYSTRYTGSADNGGVHWNSGIANLAFFLTVEGGSHPRRSGGPTITGIGMDDAVEIFYNGFMTLSSSATFMDARTACINAANAYPVSVREAVTNAWAAVGVGAVWTNSLAAPTLHITSECGFGHLYWNSIPGATQYKIYRGTSSNVANASLYRTTSGTSTGVLTSTSTYYYWVKACNASICSAYSNRVIAARTLQIIIDCY